MTRAQEITKLNEEIKRLKAQNKKVRDERDYLFNTAQSQRESTEDLRALEKSNDYLRAVIARSNKGFGLTMTKQA
jgi:cell division protein FtsB